MKYLGIKDDVHNSQMVAEKLYIRREGKGWEGEEVGVGWVWMEGGKLGGAGRGGEGRER